MAIALGNVTTNSGNPYAGGWTTSHTLGGGSNYLVVGFGEGYRGSSSVVSGITYNSISLTQHVGPIQAGGSQSAWGEIWGLANPATGANNVVINWTTDNKYAATVISDFSGVDADGTPVGATNSATGGSTTPSLSITTASGDVVVDCVNNYNTIAT